jgi:hypothetical protein
LGSIPTGYKLMQRASHRGSALEINRNRTNVRGDAWQTLLSLGARFRRQPLAPEGESRTEVGLLNIYPPNMIGYVSGLDPAREKSRPLFHS